MSYVAHILDVFVSSPGDVAQYRDTIVAYVHKWNQRNASFRKIFFNCIRWEDMVSPNIARTGQQVINQQVGDDYDIYLGVMWTRFGSPTDLANSGTEEEFERAVMRHMNGDPVRVSLMFCQVPPSLSGFNTEQYSKVLEFKKKAQGMGCLTRDFIDESSLGNAINLILDDTANRFSPASEGVNLESGRQSAEGASEDFDRQSAVNEERGLFDTIEDFEEHSDQLNVLAREWGAKFEQVQENLNSASEKLNVKSKYGRPSVQEVRPIINEVTTFLKSFAEWSEDKIVEYESVVELLSGDAFALVGFSRAVDQSNEDLNAAYDAIKQLCSAIMDANSGIEDFVDTVESGLKIDKVMNKVNNRITQVHRRLMDKNKIFCDDLLLCAENIRQMIGE